MVSSISLFYQHQELYGETNLDTCRGEDIHTILQVKIGKYHIRVAMTGSMSEC